MGCGGKEWRQSRPWDGHVVVQASGLGSELGQSLERAVDQVQVTFLRQGKNIKIDKIWEH